jgi:hypothetical protein
VGVFAFIGAQAVAISVRSAYLRAIEARLYAIRPTHVDGWPVPSYGKWLFGLWARGPGSLLWSIVGFAALTMFVATVVLPIWAVGDSLYRGLMALVYGLAGVYVGAMYVLASWAAAAGSSNESDGSLPAPGEMACRALRRRRAPPSRTEL